MYSQYNILERPKLQYALLGAFFFFHKPIIALVNYNFGPHVLALVFFLKKNCERELKFN